MKDLSKMFTPKKSIKNLKAIKKNYPHMPKSVLNKLNLWEKCYQGDEQAVIDVTIMVGWAKREDFQ